MAKLWRLAAVALCTLVPAAAWADSTVESVALAPSADCTSAANVNWTFSYTVAPTREFGQVTNLAGTVIGAFDQPSTLTSGSFTGTWISFISIPQPPNSLIGTYGGAGDRPPTADTAEYFILYNCTSRQVLYSCRGSRGSCPTTAAQGLALASNAVPAQSRELVVATLLLLGALGASRLRRSAAPRRRPVG